MRFTFLFLLISNLVLAQEKEYFSPHFQKVEQKKTPYERTYFFKETNILIEGRADGKLNHKATIYGLNNINQINEYAFYVLTEGNKNFHKDYFKNAGGVFDCYSQGNLKKQIIAKGEILKYSQIWNSDCEPVLQNGSGQNVYFSDEVDEYIFENYEDSTLVVQYGIRSEEKDTIYYSYDKMARPKEGFENFYQDLIRVLKYPGIAKIVGKEGVINVQFIVDQEGKLSDFKPLTKEGFRFEARAIKKLKNFPKWEPAIYDNRPVQTKLILPIRFELTEN